MLRRSLLWLSEQPRIFRFVRRNRLARGFARRFVAGETAAEGIAAVQGLAARGITGTLDLLGESVAVAADAEAACQAYLDILDRLGSTDGVEVNVSLKLTQMGFDISEDLCLANVTRIVERIAGLGGFLRLDMESSDYTQRTLDFYRRLPEGLRSHVGVVIQSSLRRSAEDVERLIADGVRVRLCKGAYLEPPEVAWPDKRDVDRQYLALMEQLLRSETFPGIATHDEVIIRHACQFVQQQGIPSDRFEFQMLYGVRRDLQDRLHREGHRVRVYVPFGTQWYPYLMRRLAERPANIAFILGNLVREGLSRR